ncbi:hypothetical protein ACF3OH_12395 [Chryseomicrobium aureum]|uniref:hypothetical protein n=1 Tax=Chryseomicrobium aureum TaxID=1441723 RepID=UPI00370DE1A0
MKIFQYLAMFLAGTLFLYIYAQVMPREGPVWSVLYFVIGIPALIFLIYGIQSLFKRAAGN